MKILKNWLIGDAEWYEFWMPQSGIRGGAIAGVLVSVIIALILYWLTSS